MKEIWNKTKVFFGNKKLHWLWTILLVVIGSYITTYMVQYLLLEPDLFEKLTDTKWDLI